jgi:hypothetical protein
MGRGIGNTPVCQQRKQDMIQGRLIGSIIGLSPLLISQRQSPGLSNETGILEMSVFIGCFVQGEKNAVGHGDSGKDQQYHNQPTISLLSSHHNISKKRLPPETMAISVLGNMNSLRNTTIL